MGYAASVTLAVLRICNNLEREVALIAELQRRQKVRGCLGMPGLCRAGLDVWLRPDFRLAAPWPAVQAGELEPEVDKHLLAEIRALRTRRILRTVGLAQDLADALMALADIRGAGGSSGGRGGGLLNNSALLAAAGLVSGGISAYKNWQAVGQR